MIGRTIHRAVEVRGVGFPGFARARVALAPSAPGSGIVFNREHRVAPGIACVRGHRSCLAGGRVQMVEHLLAACAGLGVTDLDIEVEGRFVPFGDGSSLRFVRAIRRAGIRPLPGNVRPVRLRNPVVVQLNGSLAAAVPAEALRLHCAGFLPGSRAEAAVSVRVTPRSFERELASARTFGRASRMSQPCELARKLGLRFRLRSLGGWILPARFRFSDETLRHKVVDLLGDLALLGRPLLADVFAYQPSHRLNHRLVRAIVSATEEG